MRCSFVPASKLESTGEGRALNPETLILSEGGCRWNRQRLSTAALEEQGKRGGWTDDGFERKS